MSHRPKVSPEESGLPPTVREAVADWWDSASDEERREWANSEEGSSDAYKRLNGIRNAVRDRQQEQEEREAEEELGRIKSKDFEDLSLEEKKKLVEEEGSGAISDMMHGDR
ncbi:hypothetical protein [Salinibacter ruber]|uniref:hypothetical protein n=2 Tax=Salinibacter ruber TaxID=146919 RepID=UPI0020745E40|nr:hypothetical protein [Salinibacter ruber]